MIDISNIDVYGFEAAIRGMRNPKNSWHLSDSCTCGYIECKKCIHRLDCPWPEGSSYFTSWCIGPNDLKLMQKLIAAGTDHRKFLRMMNVSMDIVAPLYWWKQFDTYKVGTVSNSCSTMHKITDKRFTIDDFSVEHLTEDSGNLMYKMVDMLNEYRDIYLQTKDKRYWWQLIQLLPSSYNQRRTVIVNYEVLMNMVRSRRNHKLDEWDVFCNKMLDEVPYFETLFNSSK